MPVDSSSNQTPEAATSSERQPWFDRGPAGRLRTTSAAARASLEAFASVVRDTLGGPALEVRRWPYRHAGANWWAFDAVGASVSISLRFAETGTRHLPIESPANAAGEVVDAVDAHYLFEFIERELTASL